MNRPIPSVVAARSALGNAVSQSWSQERYEAARRDMNAASLVHTLRKCRERGGFSADHVAALKALIDEAVAR